MSILSPPRHDIPSLSVSLWPSVCRFLSLSVCPEKDIPYFALTEQWVDYFKDLGDNIVRTPHCFHKLPNNEIVLESTNKIYSYMLIFISLFASMLQKIGFPCICKCLDNWCFYHLMHFGTFKQYKNTHTNILSSVITKRLNPRNK